MSSQHKNLSTHSSIGLEQLREKNIGIVISEWNTEITDALYQGAVRVLMQYGALPANILTKYVPGSFELPMGAQWLAQYKDIDAVICLGCVIQGQTRHFDFICQAVANGIIQVSLKYDKPVIFGVLTTDTQAQAQDRSGGQFGNKGEEAAITAIKMLNFNPEN